jgi:hypothetical protein
MHKALGSIPSTLKKKEKKVYGVRGKREELSMSKRIFFLNNWRDELQKSM